MTVDEKFVFALDFNGGQFKAGVGAAAAGANKLTSALEKTDKVAKSALGSSLPASASASEKATLSLSASAQRLNERIFEAGEKLKSSMAKSASSVEKVSRSFKVATKETDAWSAASAKLTSSLAALGITVSAGAALRSIVTESLALEKAMGEVSTIVDTSAVDVRAMTADVKAMAAAFGIEGVDATKSLYQALSAGVPATQAVQFLGAAATLAAAGIATLEESTDLLSSALNAYGLSSAEAAAAGDVFFQTVKDGKTTIPELSKSIGQIGPLAKSAGVDINELGAGIAALTSTGSSTSESVTQLRAAIQAFLKPSAEAKRVAQELGFDLSATNLAANGLEGTMSQLGLILQSAGAQGRDTTEAVVQLFGSVEAANAVLALTGAQADKFTQSLKNNRDAAGAADEAAKKVADTAGGKLSAAWAIVSGELSRAGQWLLDMTAYLFDAAGGVEGLRAALGVLAGFVPGAIKLVGSVIKNGIGFWQALFDSFKDYYTTFVADFLINVERIRKGFAWVRGDIEAMNEATRAIRKYELEANAADRRIRSRFNEQRQKTTSDFIDALVTLGGGDSAVTQAAIGPSVAASSALGVDRSAAVARAQQVEALRMSQERIEQERLEQQSRSFSVNEGGSVRQRYQSEQLGHERQHSYDLAGIAYDTRDLVGRRFGLALEGGIDDAAPYLQSALSGVIESAAASVTFRDSSLAASTRYATNTDAQSALFGSGLTGAQRVATISAMSRGVFGFAAGGSVPGVGTKDSVPAMLTPGEFVVTKEAARANYPALAAMNAGRDSEALFASPQGYGQEVTAPIQNATASPATRQARSVSRTTNNTVNVGGISVQGGSDKRRLVDAVVTEIQRRSKLGLMG